MATRRPFGRFHCRAKGVKATTTRNRRRAGSPTTTPPHVTDPTAIARALRRRQRTRTRAQPRSPSRKGRPPRAGQAQVERDRSPVASPHWHAFGKCLTQTDGDLRSARRRLTRDSARASPGRARWHAHSGRMPRVRPELLDRQGGLRRPQQCLKLGCLRRIPGAGRGGLMVVVTDFASVTAARPMVNVTSAADRCKLTTLGKHYGRRLFTRWLEASCGR